MKYPTLNQSFWDAFKISHPAQLASPSIERDYKQQRNV